MTSIQALLAYALKQLSDTTPSAQLDAEILLAWVMAKERSHLRAWPEKELAPALAQQFITLIEQRQQGVPVAYLTGYREFWSRQFKVSPDVLIPRADTELLIELSLGLLSPDQPAQILDLGTGSGIIAITVAAERPQVKLHASDISANALAIAQHNAQHHAIDNIAFYQSHWFSNLPPLSLDLIISNPPYIADNDPHLQQGDLRFEPKSALIAGNNGLADIASIVDTARQYLKKSGHLLLEHGYNQQQPVQDIFRQYGYSRIKTINDLAGQPRVTYGLWT
ncbi:MAG: peptide chain release factor N(5)-glutamine methyltransferase [Methylococcaceae bacterium]|jgi:release factor glutamine methyltransferase